MASHTPGWLHGKNNRLELSGAFVDPSLLRRISAAFHNLTGKSGYQEIDLDFRDCTKVYPGMMVGLCALASKYRRDGIEIGIRLPTAKWLRNLFINSGWAYLINPEAQPQTQYTGVHHLGCVQFASSTEQQQLVNRFVSTLLGVVANLRREDLAAIEWSINELTDNVLNHAESLVGGVVHLSHFRKSSLIDFAIGDAGVGIPKTLRAGLGNVTSDVDALDKAIREGITRDPVRFQGNGLFGAFRIAEICKGRFSVHSGYASLDFGKDGLHLRTEPIPFPGTLVVASLDCSSPETLAEALRFKGQKHVPVDYVELHYEAENADQYKFHLAAESESFGSRVAAEPVRTKLANLIRMAKGAKVHVDFEGVPIISSSFADEVFGKLFAELGPVNFMRTIEFKGVNSTVQSLIDRAIVQRNRGKV